METDSVIVYPTTEDFVLLMFFFGTKKSPFSVWRLIWSVLFSLIYVYMFCSLFSLYGYFLFWFSYYYLMKQVKISLFKLLKRSFYIKWFWQGFLQNFRFVWLKVSFLTSLTVSREGCLMVLCTKVSRYDDLQVCCRLRLRIVLLVFSLLFKI